jgi:hypothetical protein
MSDIGYSGGMTGTNDTANKGTTMTLINNAAVKDFARKYMAAFIAGDEAAASRWLIEWAVTKRVWFHDRNHLLTGGEFHFQCCADA